MLHVIRQFISVFKLVTCENAHVET